MPNTPFAAGALALGLLALPAAAQEVDDDSRPEPSSSDLAARVRADVDETSLRWLGIARVRYSIPLEFSAGGGAVLARMPASYDCATFCEYRGFVAQIEPGSAGAQLGVGYARVIAAQKPRSAFLNNVYVGWSARAVLVRTWGDSELDPARQTLAGFEGQFALPRITFNLGVLRRISSAHPGADRHVYTAGIGWGF
ncbi:MAG: hypothetical protein OYL92_03155 [Acidobacteriota bacterium]|nr:hypothetical protein [Acidobacteriota bacterium]MDE2924295.1 hypothetical protein [Acidobacteriota bacterium]MDE3263945.1 hypothetical protein [Acidobacteriota bacterium]